MNKAQSQDPYFKRQRKTISNHSPHIYLKQNFDNLNSKENLNQSDNY